MLAGTHPQVIERIVPAGILRKGGIRRIQMEGCDFADGIPPGAVELKAGARQCGGRHALQIVGIDADALSGPFQGASQVILLP